MLNLFPDLFFLNILTPTILRITVGTYFIIFGLSKFSHQKYALIDCVETFGIKKPRSFVQVTGLIQVTIGLFLIIGMLTQVSAILGSFILLVALFHKNKIDRVKFASTSEYILLFIITFTLILSGAGFMAIDLPL